MSPSINAELPPGRNGIGRSTTPTTTFGEKAPVTTVTVVGHRRGGISPLAPAYYLGKPARVWYEALRPRQSRTSIPATLSAATQAGVDEISFSAASPANCPARRQQPWKNTTRIEPRNVDTAPSHRRSAHDPHPGPVAHRFEREEIAPTNSLCIPQRPGAGPSAAALAPAEAKPCHK